jgi:outer membrane protein assembly factor BamB
MTEKSVFLLDARGNIEQKVPLKDYDKAVISDDGTTLAAMKGKEIIISDLIRNQIVGRVKFGDSHPFLLPQHISFEVSDKILVVISLFSNTIYFHENNGRRLSEYQFDDLRKTRIKFSRDGKYLAVHVPNWGEGKTSGFLLLFNNKGEKLWQFDHKGCEASFDISADGSSVVLAANGRLYSLNREGKTVYEKEVEAGIVEIRVSPDGGYVAFAQKNKHFVSLLSNQDGNVVWSENIIGSGSVNSLITSVSVSSSGKLAIAMSKDWSRKNKDSIMFLFDKAGQRTWKKSFENDRIKGILSAESEGILIEADNTAYFYNN